MYVLMLIRETKDSVYNQFVYPDFKGGELIVLAASMAGMVKDNQFAEWIINFFSHDDTVHF